MVAHPAVASPLDERLFSHRKALPSLLKANYYKQWFRPSRWLLAMFETESRCNSTHLVDMPEALTA